MAPISTLLPKRYIVILMGFLGQVMLYALRVNLSVAIVSMVVVVKDHDHYNNNNKTNDNITSNISNTRKFDWDESTQQLVLGSFFLGYVLFQLPGGRMADTFGSKWLMFVGIFGTSLLTIVSPIAARMHYLLFISCRIFEGMFEVYRIIVNLKFKKIYFFPIIQRAL